MNTTPDPIDAFGAGPRAYALTMWLIGLSEADRNLVLLYLAQRHPDTFLDARLDLINLRSRYPGDALRVMAP
jgi:hypothetical protein